MAPKQVPVSAHLRNGKAVRTHSRSINQNSGTRNSSSKVVVGNLSEPEISDGQIVAGVNVTQQMLAGFNWDNIAKMENCSFDGVKIDSIDLQDIEFSNCSFVNTGFEKSNMDRVSFNNCSFNGVALSDSKLWMVSFQSSELFNFEFRDSQLNQSVFDSCDLQLVEFSGWGMKEQGPTLFATNFVRTNISESTFDTVSIDGGGFTDSDLRYVAIRTSNIDFARFDKCSADQFTFADVLTRNVEVTSSKFSKSFWSYAEFQAVLFKDSSISQTNLEEIDFIDCEFDNTSVTKVKLEGGVYSELTFREAQQKLGITTNQFEFLVLSGVIEVRDNETKQIVRSGFDPDCHHIPPWMNFQAVKP